MSQAKVDNYKKEKANRKDTMRKDKLKWTLAKSVAAIVCVAVIGWVGYSVYGMANQPDTSTADVNLDSYYDYMSEIEN